MELNLIELDLPLKLLLELQLKNLVNMIPPFQEVIPSKTPPSILTSWAKRFKNYAFLTSVVQESADQPLLQVWIRTTLYF